MTLLALVLLTATPVPVVDAYAVFDRFKKLEGNWKSKDGLELSFRVISGGSAVVETLTSGPDKVLVSVTVFRIEGADLVATVDAETHQVLKAASALLGVIRFDLAKAGTVLAYATKDPDALRRETAGKTSKATDFTREYVDTLK
jgi:hypothetical protein